MADFRSILRVWAALAITLLGAACFASSAFGTANINSFTVGASTNQAGGHPDIEIHARMDARSTDHEEEVIFTPENCNCEDPEGFEIHLPTGFIGNPHNVPKCSLAQFSRDACPIDSQVGVFDSSIGEVPIYNMEPHPGEPGLTAFQIPIVKSPSFTSLSARTGSDYGLDASTFGVVHLLPVQELDIYLWGVPADPSHDALRFPADKHECIQVHYPNACFVPRASTSPVLPFLGNPTTCGVPLTASLDIAYYNGASAHADDAVPGTVGCDQLSFNPSLTALPTTTSADTASGLDVDVKVPQTQNASVPSPSEIRTVKVTLPTGFSLAPNASDGKTYCSETDLNFTSEIAAQCPEFAKIGTLELDSSALPAPIPGAIYIGQPLPGQTFRVFLVADGFDTHVKLKGEVRLDQQTGQIVTVLDNLPQAPFQEFDLHFFGSERGIYATPNQCDAYQVEAEFVPWDSVLTNQVSLSSFTIDQGPAGRPCPGPVRPFSPALVAGTPDNTGGIASPLSIRIKREDGDQLLSGVEVSLPPGLVQSIRGVTECPPSALNTLTATTYLGVDELAAAACPASSQVGTLTSGSGSGTRPLYNPGKVYLAGPYRGAPLSLVFVVPSVGGPYDLGNTVVRAAVFVDPTTAQIKTVSDSIPQILHGVPLRLRSLLFDFDLPGFNLTPTNCAQRSIDASITGDQGAVATPSVPYQVANCSGLPFAPKLSLKLSGSNKRGGSPALTAVLRSKPREANISRAAVTLPSTELLENAHIKTICSRVQYAAGSGDGAQCPADSIYGHARVWTPLLDRPLEGPVFMRSSSHELPDLVASLDGQIHIDLVGRIDTIHARIRNTFEAVPDTPVSKFELAMSGGPKSLLVNTANLCAKSRPSFVAQMVGQNGVVARSHQSLVTACAKKARHRRHKRQTNGGGK